MLLGLYSTALFAGTIDPTRSDSRYIEYGKKHECVLKIGGIYQPEDKTKPKKKFFASCVIIKPRIVLTAAHVVDGSEDVFVVNNTDEEIKVNFAIYLKEWNKNIFAHNDVAICFLEKNIDIDFYPQLYDDNNEIGKICSISGFGVTGNFIEGYSVVDNKKRAGSNMIDELFNGMLVTSVKNYKKTDLEFLIGYGDSGGGLFIDKKLAGINSGIMTDSKDSNLNSDQKDFATHTRISTHRQWIELTVEKLEELAKTK